MISRKTLQKSFFRLVPGGEVRLRYAYWIKCNEVVKDSNGEIVALECTYDPETKGGSPPRDGRKVKGTLHWVSARHGLKAELRLYDRLFSVPTPEDESCLPNGGTFLNLVNKNSLVVVQGVAEPSLANVTVGEPIQFERVGFFVLDPDSTDTLRVFNRTVSLADTWAAQTDANSKDSKHKEAAKLARAKAAAEREARKKKA